MVTYEQGGSGVLVLVGGKVFGMLDEVGFYTTPNLINSCVRASADDLVAIANKIKERGRFKEHEER